MMRVVTSQGVPRSRMSIVVDRDPANGSICPQCAAGLTWPAYADVVVCPSCGSTLAADAALRAVRCPQCAGSLAVVGGSRLLACCHCGVHVLVAAHGGFDRRRLPQRVSADEAGSIARAWLRRHPGVARAARTAPFRSTRLIYLPIWEYSALVAGWEFGYRRRMRAEFSGDEQNPRMELRQVREPVRDGRLSERRHYQTASDPASVGAARPRVTGREPLLPVLAGDLDDCVVLPPQTSADEVLERGRALTMDPLSDVQRAETRFFTLRESLTLLFYPLWRLDYEVAGHPYMMVVNGYEAAVHAAAAPLGAARRLQEEFGALVGRRREGMVTYHDPFAS